MEATQIWCPNCDRQVPAADVNIVEMVGKCVGCDHIFSIRDLRQPPGAPPSRPSGIRVESEGMDTRLILSWFHPGLLFLLFFCIAWDGFLVFWYSMALFGADKGGFVWIAILFPILHVAAGVSLTYYVICGFLNRTNIRVSKHEISVTHGPLPWRGNRRLQRDEILELELDFNGVSSEGTGQQMTIAAHHVDSRQIVLLNSLPVDKAEFLAWKIADALKVDLVRKDFNRSSRSNQMPQWLQRFVPDGMKPPKT